MEAVNDERLRAFLADSLALWDVEGTVDVAQAPAVAVVRAAGRTIYIERAPAGIPFRWLVRDSRELPCGSLLGVLTALRRALDIDRGVPLRVAPRP